MPIPSPNPLYRYFPYAGLRMPIPSPNRLSVNSSGLLFCPLLQLTTEDTTTTDYGRHYDVKYGFNESIIVSRTLSTQAPTYYPLQRTRILRHLFPNPCG
jgi:hypothetical protein